TTPEGLFLAQNYPNPFNPSTRIAYHLPEGNQVTLTIYDLVGKEIKTLVNGFQGAGDYTVQWDGTDNQGQVVGSGIYFYQLHFGNHRFIRKMMYIK
ncbi:MAG: T9SS C-terminal target domain-containing protein, partial [Calditrichaeota bacterium]